MKEVTSLSEVDEVFLYCVSSLVTSFFLVCNSLDFFYYFQLVMEYCGAGSVTDLVKCKFLM